MRQAGGKAVAALGSPPEAPETNLSVLLVYLLAEGLVFLSPLIGNGLRFTYHRAFLEKHKISRKSSGYISILRWVSINIGYNEGRAHSLKNETQGNDCTVEGPLPGRLARFPVGRTG